MISGNFDLEMLSSYHQEETLTKIYTRRNDGTLFPWLCMTFFKSLRAKSPKICDYFLLNIFSSVSSSPVPPPSLLRNISSIPEMLPHSPDRQLVSCLPTHDTRIFSDVLLISCFSWIKAPILCSEDPSTPGSSVALRASIVQVRSITMKFHWVENTRLGLSK